MNLPARRRHSGRPAPILSRIASQLAGLLQCTAPAIAGGWQPPVPMPDEFDWVQLTSGEDGTWTLTTGTKFDHESLSTSTSVTTADSR